MNNQAVSLDAGVKLREAVLWKELAGEMVLLNLDSGVYFGLDPIGTRIWQLLQGEPGLRRVLSGLLQEFDVDEARCRADLLKFVSNLRSHGLVEVIDRA
jgi:hypothetical protein